MSVRKLSAIDYMVALVILALGSVVFLGFLRPDPYYLEKGLIAYVLLWALRIGTPLLFIAISAAYLGLRGGRLSGLVLSLVLGSVVVAFALGYPIADSLYQKSYVRQIEKYHPYLQLRPNAPQLADKREDIFLIMTLGGSTTEFADDEGKGWQGRLEKLLPPTINGKKTVVLNMGRQWYTTQHILMNFALNLRYLKADMIILMQSVNDFLVNADFAYISHASFRGDYGHFYGPVNRIIDRKGLLAFIGDMVAGLWNYKPREIVSTDRFPGLASYERNIRTILELAKLDNSKVVLMSEPFLFKRSMTEQELKSLELLNYQSVGPEKRWSVETAVAGLEAYNARMQEIARSEGVPFIDLEKSVPKTFEYFYDEVHYRVGAFEVVAKSVAEGLKSSGALPH